MSEGKKTQSNGARKALIKVKEVKHVLSGQVIGIRYQAAIPNNAARNFKGEAIPSFAKKWLVGESSDFSMVSSKDLDRFTEKLKFLGFNEFPIVSQPG